MHGAVHRLGSRSRSVQVKDQHQRNSAPLSQLDLPAAEPLESKRVVEAGSPFSTGPRPASKLGFFVGKLREPPLLPAASDPLASAFQHRVADRHHE